MPLGAFDRVVASDVDGIPDALDGGKAGLLVPPKDISFLEAALVRVLSRPEEKAKWQELALQNLEEHTVGRVAQETEAVYRELLPTNGGRRGASVDNAS